MGQRYSGAVYIDDVLQPVRFAGSLSTCLLYNDSYALTR